MCSVWGWYNPGFWYSHSHMKSHPFVMGNKVPHWLRPGGHYSEYPPLQWSIFFLATLGRFFGVELGLWEGCGALSKHIARWFPLRCPSISIGLGKPLGRQGLSGKFPCFHNLGGGRITSSWLSINGWRKYQLAFKWAGWALRDSIALLALALLGRDGQ